MTGVLCGACVSVQPLRFRAGVDGAEDKVVFFSGLSFTACSVTVSMAHVFFRPLLPRLSALCLQVSNLLQLHQTHSVPTSCKEGGVGGRSMPLCFGATLNGAQIFAMI